MLVAVEPGTDGDGRPPRPASSSASSSDVLDHLDRSPSAMVCAATGPGDQRGGIARRGGDLRAHLRTAQHLDGLVPHERVSRGPARRRVGDQAPDTRGAAAGTSRSPNFAPAAGDPRRGATAYFNIAYSDVPTGVETSCPTATQIEVTPPHAVDHDVVPVHIRGVRRRDAHRVAGVQLDAQPQTQTTAPPQP